ncbi:MAG: type II toxin-antitoxin system VapC family toxin [Candidatus Nanohaloarchaea archaeon]
MEKVYVDTNIFLDAIEDRTSTEGRDLGTPAKSFFSKAQYGQFKVIVSDWTLEELYTKANRDEVKKILSNIEENMLRCGYSEEQKKEAKEKSNHWQDYLHGLIAKEQDADCIVTRDTDLRDLSGLKVKLPGHI